MRPSAAVRESFGVGEGRHQLGSVSQPLQQLLSTGKLEDLAAVVAGGLALGEEEPVMEAVKADEQKAGAQLQQEDMSLLDCGVDDMTCAICLTQMPVADIAAVKGCEHQYCVHCILQWATYKEWCPQCKAPFSYLLTYRMLDGTMMDYPVEESVTLLKRACWFQDHMRAKEKGKAIVRPDDEPALQFTDADGDGPSQQHRDWADIYEDYVDEQLEEDEEIEHYYFSSAAGSARVLIGNRRNGQNGYMRSGRMFARPVPVPPGAASSSSSAATPNGKGKKTGKGKGSNGGASGANACGSAGSSGSGGRDLCGSFGSRMPKGSSPVLGGAGPLAGLSEHGSERGGGSGGGGGGSGPGSGRRAKRAQRRVAVDSWEDDY